MVNPAGNQPAPTKPRKAEEKPKTENAGNVGPENTDVKPSGPSGLSGPADAPNPSGAPASSGTFGTHSAQDGLDPKTHFLVGQNRNTNNAGGPSGPMPSGPPRASGTSYSIQQTVDENGNYTYKEEGNNSEGSWSIESTNGPSGSTYSETFTPHDNTNASGQSGPSPSGQSGPSPSGQSGPSPSGQSGPNPSGQSGPSPSGQSGPNPSGQSGPSPSGQSGPNSKDESAIAGAGYTVHKDGKLDRDATAENIISDTEGIIGGWTDSKEGELSKDDLGRARTSINKNKDTVENYEEKIKVIDNLESNFDYISKDGRITKESLSGSLITNNDSTQINPDGSPVGNAGYTVMKDGEFDNKGTAKNIISDTEGIIGGWTNSDKGELSKTDIQNAKTSINKNKDTVENYEEKINVLNSLDENFDDLSVDGSITEDSLSKGLKFKDGKTEVGKPANANNNNDVEETDANKRDELELFTQHNWVLGWSVDIHNDWKNINLTDALTNLAESEPGDEFWSRTEKKKQGNWYRQDKSSPSDVKDPQPIINAAKELLKSPDLIKLIGDEKGNIKQDTIKKYLENNPGPLY